ncbi:hypothetical protein [Bosea sp. RAC05]|uniref:hypothetical protein n=1 Tax=Bosea sp. RAC05 TaxID=1842539 RepID=UPI00083E13C1|nr:hypothetical protein [Bosea sp. RAC05]AOG03187.1 hypothetical protein BSY19_5139 [Bosea sp. RAC05]
MAKAKLRTSPGRGKKFDTVYFDVEHVIGEGEEGKSRTAIRKVEIDLYLEKRFDQKDAPPPAQTIGVGVSARCEETGDAEFGTDLNAVLSAIRAKLDARFKIKWERWFLVKVDPTRSYDASGDGLQLSWRDIERGVTFGGDVLMRSYNVNGDWPNRWIIEPWPKVVKEQGRIVAAIPATGDNEKALQVFAAKIAELRKALAALVAPDEIERTLMQIAAAPISAMIEQRPAA